MPYTRRQKQKQVFEKENKYVTRPDLSGVLLTRVVPTICIFLINKTLTGADLYRPTRASGYLIL